MFGVHHIFFLFVALDTMLFSLMLLANIHGYFLFIANLKFFQFFFNKKCKLRIFYLLRYFRSDGGSEYVSAKFQSFHKDSGIIHQVYCPNIPDQNGTVERKHRHIIETGPSRPSVYCQHALEILGRCFFHCHWSIGCPCVHWTLFHHGTPCFTIHPITPLRKYLVALATHGSGHIPNINWSLVQKCVSIGDSLNHKGYRCLDPSAGNVFLSGHVAFDEESFPFQNPSLLSLTWSEPFFLWLNGSLRPTTRLL